MLMLILISILILLIASANAQYPWVTQSQTQTLNLCYNITDCAIYTQIYPSLTLSDMFCDAYTGRCTENNGNVLSPLFNNLCPLMSLSVVAYPSLDANNSHDGILAVSVSVPNPIANLFGSIRVYLSSVIVGNVTVETTFVQEQFVNAPVDTYIFRGLDPAAYTVEYFHVSGCQITVSPEPVVGIAYNGVYFPTNGTGITWDPVTGFFILPEEISTNRSYGFGRGVRVGFGAPWSPTYIHDGISHPADIGYGQRIPFVQFFGISGNVLFTYTGTQVLLASPTAVGQGAVYPPSGMNITNLINTPYEASLLSGVVAYQYGIGFGLPLLPVNATVPVVVFIQDYNGVYEGYMSRVFTLNQALSTGFMPAQVLPGYDVLPMFYQDNGIFANLQFMYSYSDIFPDKTILNSNPSIQIYPANASSPSEFQSTNAFCESPATPYANVQIDYSNFLFKVNPLYMQVWTTVMTQGATVFLTPISPPEPVQTVLAYPQYFTVPSVGFYCVSLSGNLLDGNGIRPLLQTCFQVGRAATGLTQLSSVFLQPNDPLYPYLPNAGYGSQVMTTFNVAIPNFMVLPSDLAPWVVLFRASVDPDIMELLIENGGDITDIFNTAYVNISMFPYYNIGQTWPNSTFFTYVAKNSIFNGPKFDMVVDGQNSAVNEIAMSTLFLVNISQVNGSIVFNTTTVEQTVTNQVETNTPTEITFFNETTMMNETIVVNVVTIVNVTTVVNVTIIVDVQGVTFGQGISVGGIQYACSTPVQLNMIEAMDLQAYIQVTPATCPDQSAAFYGSAKGGFPFQFDNPGYTVPGHPLDPGFPYLDPVAYYMQWINDEPSSPGYGNILYSGLNAVLFPSPGNIHIKLVVRDAVGLIASAIAIGFSLVQPNATMIAFLPQLPLCIGSVQYVQLTYVTNHDNDPTLNNKTDIIAQWTPLDVTAAELYNPNNPYFDLPANCSLLDTLSAFDVYFLCQAPGANSTGYNCTGCTNLPIQYAQTTNNGRSILTAVPNEWWQVIVWTRTNVFDIDTKRYVYCQTALSIKSDIPLPLALIFSQLTRISGSGPGINTTCGAAMCFSVTITKVVDPNFVAQYPPSSVNMVSFPPLQPININAGTYTVALNMVYNITLSIGGNFCPVSINYQPSANGPMIQLIRTWPTQCGSNNGQVWIYMRYNSQNLAQAGTSVPLCLYWPNRHGTNVPTDAVPLPFMAQVNPATPTVLPNSFFGNIQSFDGIRGGVQDLMIYDACNAITGSCNCLIPNTFQLTNPALQYAFDEFAITNFNNPAGNLFIDRTSFIEARCFGDSYYLNFTIYDNAGPSGLGNGPYAVEFFKPFGLGVYTIYGTCINNGNPDNPQLPPPVPFGDGMVIVASNLQAIVPTGGIQGLGVSGNYTMSVMSCATGCVATFPTYIDIVQPMVAFLSSAGTSCAYNYAQLVPQVVGGTPFLPGNNQSVPLTYVYPGSTVIHFSPYIMKWKTPFNPNNFTELFLQLDVIPGYYELEAIDANGCVAYANITVLSAPPITVTLAGFDAVCQSSNQSVVRFNVSGGIPPYTIITPTTQITTNTTVDASFVATYNQSSSFFVLDSSGCLLPTPVSFQIPNPGPVNLTSNVVASCSTVNTGSIDVTSDQPITCRWQAVGTTLPLIQTCFLHNLPAGSLLTVVASTIIGCTATQTYTVPQRTPIVMMINYRSTNGEYGGPCIDTINITIIGGQTGPPYVVALVNDVTNATLNYDGMNTIVVNSVCRSYIYTVLAMENTFTCPVTLVSTDPGFIFGGGPANGLLGLPPPNNMLFLPVITVNEGRTTINWMIALPLVIILGSAAVASAVALSMSYKRVTVTYRTKGR